MTTIYSQCAIRAVTARRRPSHAMESLPRLVSQVIHLGAYEREVVDHLVQAQAARHRRPLPGQRRERGSTLM